MYYILQRAAFSWSQKLGLQRKCLVHIDIIAILTMHSSRKE